MDDTSNKPKGLTREDIISKLEELELPESGWWVGSSAALVLHGVKEYANDVDLWVQRDTWGVLRQRFTDAPDERTGMIDFSPFVEAGPTDDTVTIDTIGGVPTASLDDVRQWKAGMGRPKDLADIELIDEFMAQQSAEPSSESTLVSKYLHEPSRMADLTVLEDKPLEPLGPTLSQYLTEHYVSGAAPLDAINIWERIPVAVLDMAHAEHEQAPHKVCTASQLLEDGYLSVDDELLRSKAWQDGPVLWSHGVSFVFSKTIGRALWASNTVEHFLLEDGKGYGDICVARGDEFCGRFGYFLQGTPHVAFGYDAVSKLDDEGRRYVLPKYIDALVSNSEEMQIKKSEAGKVASIYADQLLQEIVELERISTRDGYLKKRNVAYRAEFDHLAQLEPSVDVSIVKIGSKFEPPTDVSIVEKEPSETEQYLMPNTKLISRVVGWFQKLFGAKETDTSEILSAESTDSHIKPSFAGKLHGASPLDLMRDITGLYKISKTTGSFLDAASADDVRKMSPFQLLGIALGLDPREVKGLAARKVWRGRFFEFFQQKSNLMSTPMAPGERYATLLRQATEGVVQEVMPGIVDHLGIQRDTLVDVVGTPIDKHVAADLIHRIKAGESPATLRDRIISLTALGVHYTGADKIALYPLNTVLARAGRHDLSLEFVTHSVLAHESMHQWQDERHIRYEWNLPYWQRASERVAYYFGERHAVWGLDEQYQGRLFDAVPEYRQSRMRWLPEAARRNQRILGETFGWAKADVSMPIEALSDIGFESGHRLTDELQELAKGVLGAYYDDIAEALELDPDTEIGFRFASHASDEGTFLWPTSEGGYEIWIDLARTMHQAAGRDDFSGAWQTDLPSAFGAQVVQDTAATMYAIKHGYETTMPTTLDDGTEGASEAAQWSAQFVKQKLETAGYQHQMPSHEDKKRMGFFDKFKALFGRSQQRDTVFKDSDTVASSVLEPESSSRSPLVSDGAKSTVVKVISDTGKQLAELSSDDAGEAVSKIEQIADRSALTEAAVETGKHMDRVIKKPSVIDGKPGLSSYNLGSDVVSTLLSMAIGKTQEAVFGAVSGALIDASEPTHMTMASDAAVPSSNIVQPQQPSTRVELRNRGWQKRRINMLAKQAQSQQDYSEGMGSVSVQQPPLNANININIDGNPGNISTHRLDEIVAKTIA